MPETMGEVREALPAEPSRESARRYTKWAFALAALQAVGIFAVTVMTSDQVPWPALAVVNAMVVVVIAIRASQTTLDINKLADSATKVMLAKVGG